MLHHLLKLPAFNFPSAFSAGCSALIGISLGGYGSLLFCSRWRRFSSSRKIVGGKRENMDIIMLLVAVLTVF